MQLSLFQEQNNDKILTGLFQAYFDTRKNKRNTVNSLSFEKYFEANIFQLFEDIINHRYKVKRSICFIAHKPVKREIFAANFRDRIVHHFIFNTISPIFEKTFINDSYSCRKGKGTHYGIKRMESFIRSSSRNYTKDSYILKLDIKGYFMAMNRTLLYNKVKSVLMDNIDKIDFDLSLFLYLIKKTIFNDPTSQCIVKGRTSEWVGLPKTKSLFYAKANCGLPIGNLTSQLFGNIYLNEFDHFVKRDLKIRYYGRYVDDFVLIHDDKEYLKLLIPRIKEYLAKDLHLELHLNKIYLQHFSKGVRFLGAVIKPHRKYISNRTKGNFYNAILKYNQAVRYHKPESEIREKFLSCMNSYLGLLKHYKTYNVRKKMIIENLSGWWWNYVYLSGGVTKFVQKVKIKKNNRWIC